MRTDSASNSPKYPVLPYGRAYDEAWVKEFFAMNAMTLPGSQESGPEMTIEPGTSSGVGTFTAEDSGANLGVLLLIAAVAIVVVVYAITR